MTCFAPTDQALENYLADGKPLTRDVIMNHFVSGRVPAGMISGDLQSLQGSVLKYERKFRKTFLNEAIIGQADNFGGAPCIPRTCLPITASSTPLRRCSSQDSALPRADTVV